MYALAVRVAPISVEEAESSTPASLTAPALSTASPVVASTSFTPAFALTLTYLPSRASVSVREAVVAPSISAQPEYLLVDSYQV